MQETKELNAEEAKKAFIKLRNDMDKIANESPFDKVDEYFADAFSKVYTDATIGDVVCQDYLGYIFKRGKPNLVPENIDLSMKWLLLASANGNHLSIERLSIFLNYAYDEIVYQPDFGLMCFRNNIDAENYSCVIGKLLCEAIVDDLKINALEIIKEIPTTLEHNPTTMGIYDKARNRAIPVVLKFLRGIAQNQEDKIAKQIEEEENKPEFEERQPKPSIIEKVFKKKNENKTNDEAKNNEDNGDKK